jgi:menaquinone reductase, multiheme cytochrome c subunit
MARFLFPEWTQPLKKYVITPALLIGPVYIVALAAIVKDPQTLRIGYQPEQPVPYSHALHAGEMGMDCRYCHTVVEVSNKAAVPPAQTCMNCHATVHPKSDKLTPVREAYFENKPLRWTRVTDLPDYVYFNHSAHVTRGVGCESCHGRVDQMVKVFQAKALTMQWCLDCHRDPDANLRWPQNVTVMGYKPQPGEGAEVRKQLAINPPTDCSTCHR